MPREQTLACAMRLLDRGFFRIGSEDYAEENDTYGLATMRKRHVTRRAATRSTFDYEAKGGKRRVQAIGDPEVARDRDARSSAAAAAARSCSPTARAGAGWTSSRADINEYVKEAAGRRLLAPRTSAPGTRPCWPPWRWPCPASPPGPRPRASAGQDAARSRRWRGYLGNTPAVCRASYIDPRVFDRFDGGLTIGGVLEELAEDNSEPDTQVMVESAVLDLLNGDRASDAVERARELAKPA